MNDVEHIIYKSSRRISLRDDEKAAVRMRLLSLAPGASISQRIVLPFYSALGSFAWRHTASFAFVALLFFSGGLSALADKALPGSMLYPLKTGINEQVLSLFAVSKESKVEFNILLAQRRLTEAELIADEPSISPEVKEDHLKVVYAQVTVAAGEEEEETTAPVTSAMTKMAPQAVMMQATHDNTTPELHVVSLMNATAAVEVAPREDISNLRASLKKLQSILAEKEHDKGEMRERSIRAESKLLVAQKKLLEAADEKISVEKKNQYVDQAKEIIKQAQLFIDSVRQESKETLIEAVPVSVSDKKTIPAVTEGEASTTKDILIESNVDPSVLHN